MAFFGRIQQAKDVDSLSDMMASPKPEFPDIRLAIKVNPSYWSMRLDKLEKRDVPSIVDYLGVVPTGTIPNVPNDIQAVLYPL